MIRASVPSWSKRRVTRLICFGSGLAGAAGAPGGAAAATDSRPVSTKWTAVISCLTPSSKTWISSGPRSRTSRPFLSRTTTSSMTTPVSTRNVGGEAGFSAGACARAEPPRATARRRAAVRDRRSGNNALALHDADVPVHRRVFDPLDAAAGSRPLDLEPVEPRRRAEADHLAGIVRGQVAPAARLEPGSLDPAHRPGQPGPHRIAGAPRALEAHAHPVVALAGIVLEDEGRSPVVGHDDVHPAVVVEVPHGQSARRKTLREQPARFVGDVAELLAVALEEEQRLLVLHVPAITVDHVVGEAVGQQQIEIAVVVEREELEAPASQWS